MIKKRHLSMQLLSILLLLIILIVPSFQVEARERRKILIFYTQIGMGHRMAAEKIIKGIHEKAEKQNQEVDIWMKDMRALFIKPIREQFIKNSHLNYMQNYPQFFDILFHSMGLVGNLAPSLTTFVNVAKEKYRFRSPRFFGPKNKDSKRYEPNVSFRDGKLHADLAEEYNQYNKEGIFDYIKKIDPDIIICTHFGAAEALGDLREKKGFRSILSAKDRAYMNTIPIAWLHTDYFQGYFSRISERIDMTFLPIDSLKAKWIQRGVHPKTIQVTGMPINVDKVKEMNREKTFEKLNLPTDKEIKTITIAGGGEGMVPFEDALASIFKSFCHYKPNLKGFPIIESCKIQIVTVCGTSQKCLDDINEYKTTLPSNLQKKIHPKGFVENHLFLSLVNYSNLYITKAGGLSPTEGIALQVPMLLFTNTTGQEKVNAKLFEKENLAILNTPNDDLGEQALSILRDDEEGKKLRQKMNEEQVAFANNINLNKIVDYALDTQRNESLSNHFSVTLEPGVGRFFADQKVYKKRPLYHSVAEIYFDLYGKNKNLLQKQYGLKQGVLDKFTNFIFRSHNNTLENLLLGRMKSLDFRINERVIKIMNEELGDSFIEENFSDYLFKENITYKKHKTKKERTVKVGIRFLNVSTKYSKEINNRLNLVEQEKHNVVVELIKKLNQRLVSESNFYKILEKQLNHPTHEKQKFYQYVLSDTERIIKRFFLLHYLLSSKTEEEYSSMATEIINFLNKKFKDFLTSDNFSSKKPIKNLFAFLKFERDIYYSFINDIIIKYKNNIFPPHVEVKKVGYYPKGKNRYAVVGSQYEISELTTDGAKKIYENIKIMINNLYKKARKEK